MTTSLRYCDRCGEPHDAELSYTGIFGYKTLCLDCYLELRG